MVSPPWESFGRPAEYFDMAEQDFNMAVLEDNLKYLNSL
jgi:hypothetical protein